MKRNIQRSKKTNEASADKKNTRPFSAKKKGYKEDVYNKEEQSAYEKSQLNTSNKNNTAGPKS